MSSPRITRSSVLGKRPHQPPTDTDSPSSSQCDHPTPNPKRAKLDAGNNNKENIPPWSDDPLPVFPYAADRALRRTSTEVISPPRPLRTLLRPTCNSPVQIPGRDNERDLIRQFTALLNAILHALQSDFDSHDATVLSVNCMAFNTLDALWEQLAQDLDADAATGRRRGRKIKETPSQRVQRLLAGRDSKCVLILDELDHIASSSQALDALFALAHANASHLCLIGIANTHTLTSSVSSTASARTHSNVKTLHFAPYSAQQLLEILKSRLSPLSSTDDGVDGAEMVKKFLPVPALTLLTKKIASQTGDVRALFEVLRGAIDLAAIADASSNPLDTPTPIVTPSLILSALKAYAPAGTPARSPAASSLPTPGATPDSETVAKVRDLGLHARLALLAIFIATKRLDAGLTLSGSPAPSAPSTPVKRTQSSSSVSPAPSKAASGMDSTQLHAHYSAVLTRGEHTVFSPVSRSEFSDLLGMLETVGLVTLGAACASQPGTPSKSGRRAFGRAASFNVGGAKAGGQDVRFVEGVRLDEVARGLGVPLAGAAVQQEAEADVREEEVRAIWERERARISRESKAARADTEVFAHALED
ncbi:P-loop containing nucleoside triphosphate hydrolase protein [Amylocystis lapponica]|nr:P-loop containing nucleoside triphosphate hydrolase protein [Amylocystis lapponica]